MESKTKNRILPKKTRTTKLVLLALFVFFLFHAVPSYSLSVDTYDNYGFGAGISTSWGSPYDAISWIEDSCPISGFSGDTQWTVFGVYDNNFDVGAYCVNTDYNADSDYDFCIIKNSTWATNCSGTSFPVTPVTESYTSSTWAYADSVDLYTDTPICDGEAGNTMVFSSRQTKTALVKYYCRTPSNNTCHDCGTSSGRPYYYIDQLRTSCPSDGDVSYDLQGRYATSTYIYIDSLSCATNTICDTDHQYSTSTTATSLPTSPCKLQDGEACSSSSDCWHNHACSGAHTEYDGYCSGSNLKIETIPYSNACGGGGYLGTITEVTKNCVSDGGYPTGYVCDPAYDLIIQSSVANVYASSCKGTAGSTCLVNSDCFTGLNCVSGHCMYDAYTVFTDNSTDEKLYTGQTLSFDPSLSDSSDHNIQFSCWRYNGTITKCYGNSSQCTSQCSGATYSGSNWATIYTKTFNDGGNFAINLTTGSAGKYSSSYQVSYCVSGNGNYCWSCFDNLQNDDETNIDWGGHCGTPYFVKCNNNILDNVTLETQIDYGGACGNCTANVSKNDDLDWLFLRDANFITYPFNSSLCPESKEIQGFVASFVLIISAILVAPLVIIGFIVLIMIFVTGFDIVAVIFLIFREKKYIKRLGRDLTRVERRVLADLKRYGKQKVSKLGSKLNMSPEQLKTALKVLIETGIIDIAEYEGIEYVILLL